MNVKILKYEELGCGEYVKLEKVHYCDTFGVKRQWEKCSRVNSCGAVIIVPEIYPDEEFILVRQYRIPVEQYVIEFPAGLVDDGESVEKTALRELYEETGYEGEITQIFPSGFSSPGMSGESATIVKVMINGDNYRNIEVTNHQEASEDIEIFRVKKSDYVKFIEEHLAAGDGVDNKLFMLML